MYCVRWSSGRVVLTWGRCWPLHHTAGVTATQSQVPSAATLRTASVLMCFDCQSEQRLFLAVTRLVRCAAQVGSCLPTFRDSVFVPFTIVKHSTYWTVGHFKIRPTVSLPFGPLQTLKLKPTGWLEMSVSTCQSTRRNIPEERGPKLHGGGSLISGSDCFCFPKRPDLLWGQHSLILKGTMVLSRG